MLRGAIAHATGRCTPFHRPLDMPSEPKRAGMTDLNGPVETFRDDDALRFQATNRNAKPNAVVQVGEIIRHYVNGKTTRNDASPTAGQLEFLAFPCPSEESQRELDHACQRAAAVFPDLEYISIVARRYTGPMAKFPGWQALEFPPRTGGAWWERT